MAHREMLEQTLVNLVYDTVNLVDVLDLELDIDGELSEISEDGIIALLNRVIENMN